MCIRDSLSDAIYVVDIGGYIGSMTREEIKYAKENGKEIIFHSEYVLSLIHIFYCLADNAFLRPDALTPKTAAGLTGSF